MNEQGEHPAGRGLLDSGYVVSVVRSAAELQTNVMEDDGFVCVTIPGNPCAVLLCCSRKGGEALVNKLGEGLARLADPR